MTVLDISRTSQQEAIADTELAADDAQRLHLMEAMLRGRGYSRNQHGFWTAPGSRMIAVKVDTITSDTGSEDEE